ncbi:hypothetical protein [Streptomyces longwoodensis]|uniref:hypothetical protein n=1 Tax=Streptomyces longwoodensis TaxID=68231 RepID=UPI000834F540|nr:hypothetical protein [Streptomyces longwoodensis]
MRRLPVRHVASTALCAALVIGIAGPAAAAVGTAREHAPAAAHAPVPGADELLAQVKSLGDLGTVLTPVTDLLADALKSDSGQLTSAQATKLGDAIKDVIARITATNAAASATSSTPSAPSVAPSSSSADELPYTTLPFPLGKNAHDRAAAHGKRAADLTDEALADLQKQIDVLLTAVTSGNVTDVVPAATGLISRLVNLVTATLLGSGLPAADLAALPSLPDLPATPDAPVTPALPALPDIPALPETPAAPETPAVAQVPAAPLSPAAAAAVSQPSTPVVPAT